MCNHPDLLRKSAGKEVVLEDALLQLFDPSHSVGAPMHSGTWAIAAYSALNGRRLVPFTQSWCCPSYESIGKEQSPERRVAAGIGYNLTGGF